MIPQLKLDYEIEDQSEDNYELNLRVSSTLNEEDIDDSYPPQGQQVHHAGHDQQANHPLNIYDQIKVDM
jgi:hypothetical protein